jgi:hypothetical protein
VFKNCIILIMKLRIYKNNDRYEFSVDGFSSAIHHKCVPNIQKNYKFAYQAMSDAKKLAYKKSYHIESIKMQRFAVEDLSKPVIDDPEAEDLLIGHYKTMLKNMTQKVMGIDDNEEDERKLTYLVLVSQVDDLLRVKEALKEKAQDTEIDKIIDGYRKIAQKHFSKYLAQDKKEKEAAENAPATPVAPNMPEIDSQAPIGSPTEPNMTMASKKISLTEEDLIELFEHYGCQTCKAVAKHHPDAISKISFKDGKIDIVGIDNGEKLLAVHVNDKFNVSNIIPLGTVAESYPSYSPKFYQRYWKPVVEAIGHFYLDEFESLIVPELGALPDMPNDNGSFDIIGWNPYEYKEKPISLSFDNKSTIWKISSSKKKFVKSSKYTEEDFMVNQPTRVMCVDRGMELFKKIGEVVEIVPIGEIFYVDVNFGRKIVRLSPDQIEIIDGM